MLKIFHHRLYCGVVRVQHPTLYNTKYQKSNPTISMHPNYKVSRVIVLPHTTHMIGIGLTVVVRVTKVEVHEPYTISIGCKGSRRPVAVRFAMAKNSIYTRIALAIVY